MKTVIKKKNIILGVSGGIAAYKSVELLRLLVKQGANVRVMMTENARWFVGPLTFEALSGQPVCTDLFEKNDDASIRHIQWAEAADAVVIAPATANIIGKLSGGIADDALSTFLLAVTCPVIVCPSMNTHMFESRAVQRNLETLRADGHFIVDPESGTLACGTTGPGRLPEPEDIVDRIAYYLSTKDLKDKKILV
ncbi:MAG: bifunctional phosphopantothenoylcysteine decarboxylase/phosphopantothenate--cysteine ligase CoaBC, partial [Deltaproteobacteria bacterium]|nr:bifunctional phosphopantothenoylcysteine decarboxylase/phosphopantothenate--cysteine ligase CoaBC [Deltaproteobacteria bacterium]